MCLTCMQRFGEELLSHIFDQRSPKQISILNKLYYFGIKRVMLCEKVTDIAKREFQYLLFPKERRSPTQRYNDWAIDFYKL